MGRPTSSLESHRLWSPSPQIEKRRPECRWRAECSQVRLTSSRADAVRPRSQLSTASKAERQRELSPQLLSQAPSEHAFALALFSLAPLPSPSELAPYSPGPPPFPVALAQFSPEPQQPPLAALAFLGAPPRPFDIAQIDAFRDESLLLLVELLPSAGDPILRHRQGAPVSKVTDGSSCSAGLIIASRNSSRVIGPRFSTRSCSLSASGRWRSAAL